MLPLSFSLVQHNTAFDMLSQLTLQIIFRGKLSFQKVFLECTL